MPSSWQPDIPGAASDKEATNLPLSHLAIPVVLPNSVRIHLQAEHVSSPPSEYHPEKHLLPSCCNCGAGWKQYDEEYRIGTYYTVSFVSSVRVYYRRCCLNKCSWHFDGQSVGVFNYSGETLVSYTLLKEFFNCSVKNAMSWAGFLEKINNMYGEVYSAEETPFVAMSASTLSRVIIYVVEILIIYTQGGVGLLEAAIEINK